MTVVAFAVLCAIQMIALVLVTRMLIAHHGEELRQAAFERRELLNRVQHPQLIPVTTPPEYPDLPEPEPDNMELVGTIAYEAE